MHAVLRSGPLRDYGEEMQRMALGGAKTDWTNVDRLRREYRQGLPRNPNLKHRYLVDEAAKAWDAGERKVTALCGELATIGSDPRTWGSPSDKNRAEHNGYVIAEQFGDTEYEDPETGLWWIDMDCVDCCRVSNAKYFSVQRTYMEQFLAWFACRPESIEDSAVSEVVALLKRLYESTRNQTD